MKRMVTVRQAHAAFGRGTLRLLYPRNRKILAYLREHEGDKILCVANLARAAQAVELDLKEFRGHVPVELLGRSPFPPIGDLPYLLTLPGHGFYWFVLAEEASCRAGTSRYPSLCPTSSPWSCATRGSRSSRAERAPARPRGPAGVPGQPALVRRQGSADHRDDGGRLGRAGRQSRQLPARRDRGPAGRVAPRNAFLPLATSYDDQALTHGWPLLSFSLAQVRRGAKVGPSTTRWRVAISTRRVRCDPTRRRAPSSDGTLRFWSTSAASRIKVPQDVEVKRLSVEQSNSSAVIGNRLVFKSYRKLAPGVQPEIEIGRFLTEEVGFANTPLLGAIERVAKDGTTTALAAAFGFVRNQGNGWVYTIEYLQRTLDELRLVAAETPETASGHEPHGFYLAQARVLGQRTAELHRALATPTDDAAFAAEPITKADLGTWQRSARHQADAAFKALRRACRKLEGADRDQVQALLARRNDCDLRIEALTAGEIAAAKTRIHGDYHLGQVLVAQNDFYILDFEGEPARPLSARRAKSSPLKDVAGMLRSFDYAACAAVTSLAEAHPGSATVVRAWRMPGVGRPNRRSSKPTARPSPVPELSRDPLEAGRLLDLFLLEKALYEICYEAANRPDWIGIPLKGVTSLLEPEALRDDPDRDQSATARFRRHRGPGPRRSWRPVRPARRP